VIGLERGVVRLVDYTPEWKRLFEEEKATLDAVVGERVLDIQHVGSTSIPGMPAKPIIDIAIAVDDYVLAAACIGPIVALGYEYRGDNGIPRRHYFTKRDPRSTHHVHMVESTSWDWERMLLFRDRLTQDPALAQEYADTKTRLAQRFEQDRGAYQRGKVSFIDRVVGPRPETEARIQSLSGLPPSRRWRNQAYPVASVLAIIRRDATIEDRVVPRFLLIQRQKEPYTGKWGLIGGRWEFGESLDTAITREVKEETDLDTAFVALRGVVSERIAPGSADVDGAHYVLFVCELSAPSGMAREQSEGPVAWFSPHDIVELQDRKAIIVTDHAILQRFAHIGDPLTYLEIDVVTGEGADKADQLVRLIVGP
jgi:GrpB-like predicted nucleotidyltransferase (UPF0157 family)/ADP-ribose pyrophosphatase YjhB (NUDIX family)